MSFSASVTDLKAINKRSLKGLTSRAKDDIIELNKCSTPIENDVNQRSATLSSKEATRKATKLVRFCGGIAFQPIYTFPDKIRPFADLLRSDLLRSSSSLLWISKGFQVTIEETCKVKIQHVNHKKWFTSITQDDVYFQYDLPVQEDIVEVIGIQADIFNRISSRIGVETSNSFSTKFISMIPYQTEANTMDQLLQLLALDPRQTLLKNQLFPITEIAFRIGYRFDSGSAAIQVSSDVSGEYFLVDFDCFCTDLFASNGDYLQFMKNAFNHFSTEVKLFLASLEVTGDQPARALAVDSQNS